MGGAYLSLIAKRVQIDYADPNHRWFDIVKLRRVHKGEKPFKCRVCEKSFTSTALRNQHMVVHWGHKTYICDVCGKGFMSRKHFKDHMRIHDGEQPHKCETCGKDFIYYRSLVRHMLVHIDPRERPKPYKCEYCNKEYTEVTGFKHHMRAVHTGETPFQCDICGESFHRNDKLKRHIKSRHHVAKGNKELIVTTRRASHGFPVIVKAENEHQEDLLEIVEGNEVEGGQNELHVDVIQQENDGQQQVYLIGLGQGGEAAYLQEIQVIEGPDGTRYIIAGSGEELQVIESSNLQVTEHVQEGEIVEGGVIQQIQQVEHIKDSSSGNILVMNDGEEQTLSTLANMASEASVVKLD
ncbi:zinc finger protein 229-like [Ruditapes philippinarum]|uniref:zinc finger protein 229-like n=1 Tax=Ruditapes philippinarum TaxID=129788 RepID=UPI00295BF197|nr:zinc finger protein 229-like [Ruditapes philippinarum]